MDRAPPKLRPDLLQRPQAAGDAGPRILKDPATGEFYRLGEVEGFIADRLDGETPPERICQMAQQAFGGALSREELDAFVAALDRRGLLHRDGRHARAPRPRLAGNLLSLRFRLLDPDRFLNRLAPRVRWAFSRGFLVASLLAIALALAVVVLHAGAIAADLSGLWRLSTLPLLLAVVFLTTSLHELAHAATCKHHGGEVREMGFMLLYLQPALYCNVSDAWLFPEKSKRLWVGFSGPYFELVLGAVAVLLWRLADSGTAVREVATLVMATTGVKTLFNFNPLIKLDGYYLLSDLLEMPNLRGKSFAWVGDRLRALAGGETRAVATPPRERRIFLAYGVSAWLFSVSLIAYLGWMFGEYLVVEGQRLAFVGLSGIVAFRLRERFASLFRRRRGGSDRTPPGDPAPIRARGPWGRRALRLGLAGALVAGLFAGRLELRVAGPITVLPHHNADVRAEIEGMVDEIYVDEGERVRRGQVIARLSDRELQSELHKTNADIERTRARLDELVAGPTRAEIELARRSVETADDRLGFAAARRERIEALFERQLLARQDFDAARETEAAAVNQVAEARGRLQVLLQGTRPEQIEAARAELRRLEAHRGFLEGQLRRVEVRSPADGVVTTPGRELRRQLRQVVEKGGLIAKVYELRTITVETAVSEKEIADVRVGQRVRVKTRAHPERVFEGRVIAIGTTSLDAPAATSAAESAAPPPANGAATDGAAAIRVTTEISNSEGLLKPGMTGMAKIDCGERRPIDLILRRLSRTFRVEFWSWW